MRQRWQHALHGLVALAALHGAFQASHPPVHSRIAFAASGSQSAADARPSTGGAGARVDSTRLMEDVRTLSAPELGGRLTGTDGNRHAQAFILNRFRELGLQPIAGAYEQKFSATTTRRQDTLAPVEATNLVAMIPGSTERDEFILVTAHYDHLGVRNGRIYPGADDNASGVAAMLAVARWFAADRPRKSLVFIAFDAEEHGLQGSRHFVANPPIALQRVSVVVNLDMVGRGDSNVIHVAGTYHTPALEGPMRELARSRSITVIFGHDRPGLRAMDDWTQSSDHGPFHSAGIPFLYFGVEDHADYHKPSDTADRIPAAFFRHTTELVLDTVRRLSEMPAVGRAVRKAKDDNRRVSR